MWKEEQVTEAWKESLFIIVHKKVDKLKYINEGISLVTIFLLFRQAPLAVIIAEDNGYGFTKNN